MLKFLFKRILSLFILVITFSISQSFAQQLIYTPVNPSFGGYYYNGQTLLSEAQAQNGFTAPQSSSTYSPYGNTLQSFTQSLQSQILGQLSQKIMTNIFGESGLTQGHYEIGNFIIDVNPSSDGVNISIFDSSTGGTSNIIVPYF